MKTSLSGRKHCADKPTQLALTARERCRAIAGGHDVLPEAAALGAFGLAALLVAAELFRRRGD